MPDTYRLHGKFQLTLVQLGSGDFVLLPIRIALPDTIKLTNHSWLTEGQEIEIGEPAAPGTIPVPTLFCPGPRSCLWAPRSCRASVSDQQVVPCGPEVGAPKNRCGLLQSLQKGKMFSR